METKICTKCKTELSLDNFCKDKKRKDGLCIYCRTCIKNRCKEYREKYKEGARDAHLKFYYGISLEKVFQIYKDQAGLCAICEKELDFWSRKTHLDHCHETNKVRGLLCVNCNVGLGRLGDNYKGVKKALDYLEKFECDES